MVACAQTARALSSRCRRSLKPVGHEAAICKRLEGGALPSFWFMEDQAGSYEPIIRRSSSATLPVENVSVSAVPQDAPATSKQEALAAKQKGKNKQEAKQEALRPASPPAAEATSSQPGGAAEATPPSKPSSWAKVAALAPSPQQPASPLSPAIVPAMPKVPEHAHVHRQAGAFILGDYVH